MDLPLTPEGPLAQPTRAQIFAFLVEKRESARTEEIADQFGLHPNGVRRHLERLEEKGFVHRRQVREGQGRPRDHWSISPGAHPGGDRPRAYEELARWLARTIPRTSDRLHEIEQAAYEIGREMAPKQNEDLVETFRNTLAALGFQPTIPTRSAEGFTCSLGNCPYSESVPESAEVVCRLHRGMTSGILAELDPDAELVRFEPQLPEARGCLIEVSGGSPAD